MKVLVIADEVFASGFVLAKICEVSGHEAHYIEAPLIYTEKGYTSYAPEIAGQVLTGARDLAPDWVIMMLQGYDSFGQIELATAIHKQTPTAKFFFMSGHDHDKEMDHASACGLDLRFQFVPVDFEELLTILEKPPYGGQWQRY
jgi:hypothetical protein